MLSLLTQSSEVNKLVICFEPILISLFPRSWSILSHI